MKASDISQRTVYPMMEAATCSLPPRSRLYRIEPIGIGTPFTESLTSYICRLAKAHHVTMNSLFYVILNPALGNKYHVNTEKHSPGTGLSQWFRNQTKNVNGTGSTAFHWIRVIESLTMRHDLSFLTLIKLSAVMPHRYLLRAYQAWCPECYEESRLNNQAIHIPIIWSIRVVETCSRHLRRLIDRCPSCSKHIPPLSRRAFPGYCSCCSTWLGTEHKDESVLIPESQVEWHTAVSCNIGKLIAAVPSWESVPTRDGVVLMFRACIAQVAGGVMAEFGKLIDKDKVSVWGWCNGTVRATLNEILKICYCLDISLVDFISGSDKQLSDLRLVRRPPDNYISCPRRANKRIDYDKAEIKLREILCMNIAISMEEAARIVGVERRTLYKKFKEVCNAISKRYTEYQRAKIEGERQRLKEEITEACLRLREQGFYPSKRRIAEYLGKPGYANRRDVSAIARTFR